VKIQVVVFLCCDAV